MAGTGSPTKRVLVVEDDPSTRRLLHEHLKRLGFEVVLAPEGRTAIAALDSQRFDLVCLDLMLPELSGYDLCEHIRKTHPPESLPILMLSGRALPEDRAHAEEVGASGYLIKPFAAAELKRWVRQLTDSSPSPG